MSDDPNTTAEETVEPAAEQDQSAVETADQDVGALKRALEHEREERRQAKEELRRLREEEDAFRELAEARGFQLPDDDETDTEVEEDFEEDDEAEKQFLTRKEYNEERAKAEQAEQWQGWKTHIDHLAEQAGVSLSEWHREWLMRQSGDQVKHRDVDVFMPKGEKATEKVFGDLVKAIEAERESAVERWRSSKKAPHVSQAGEAATEQPDLDDDNTRRKYMAERLAALNAES